MPPTKLPVSNFDDLLSLELIAAVVCTDEETDVTELLWAVVTVDVEVWDVVGETLVFLVVGFKVVEFVWDGVTGIAGVVVPFFETEETGVGDGVVEDLVDFGVVLVLFFEAVETEVVGGFVVVSFPFFEITASVLLLAGNCGLLPVVTVRLVLEPSGSMVFFATEEPPDSPLSTASLIIVITSSIPRATRAQALRAPSPIVLRREEAASCVPESGGGAVASGPSVPRRRLAAPAAAHAAPPAAGPPMTK